VRIVVHPEAAAELRDAAQWYDDRRSGLGEEFLEEVAASFSRIARAPESHARWPGVRRQGTPIRRTLLHRFPYAVAFEDHGAFILVLAVAHAKRRPLYWISRSVAPE
jgi:toxin ParE1/3/4